MSVQVGIRAGRQQVAKPTGQQKLRKAVERTIESLQSFSKTHRAASVNNIITNDCQEWFSNLEVGIKKPFKNPHDYNAVLHGCASRRDAPSAILWSHILTTAQK